MAPAGRGGREGTAATRRVVTRRVPSDGVTWGGVIKKKGCLFSPAMDGYSHSQLATLLADSYKDADNLRKDLAAVTQRAEKAERLLRGFQQSAPDASSSSSSSSPDIARVLMDYEERLSRAERARDDAEARRRATQEHWNSLERYLANIEMRAQDARAHYARVVSGDPSAGELSKLSTPAFPLFPHAPPRRPRTPSGDAAFQAPPTKRPRGNSDDRQGVRRLFLSRDC